MGNYSDLQRREAYGESGAQAVHIAGEERRTGVSIAPRQRIQEGFGLHFDDHDVVVVQLEGVKRWKIHEPTRIAPLRIDVEAPEPPQGEPIAEIVLRAGACPAAGGTPWPPPKAAPCT